MNGEPSWTIDSTGNQTETPFIPSDILVTEEPIVTPTPDATEATESAEGVATVSYTHLTLPTTPYV